MVSDSQAPLRLSPERLATLLSTVRELLLEVGYERLTIDAVAARARTSKATLYRHWGNKSTLVMAALTHPDAQHGPLLADTEARTLDEALDHLARSSQLSDGDLRMGFMLLQAASIDPDFAAELRTEIIQPLADQLAAVFHAAADRGEIVRDTHLFTRLAHLILTDTAFFPLINGRQETAADRRRLIRSVIRPALTGPDGGGAPTLRRRRPGQRMAG